MMIWIEPHSCEPSGGSRYNQQVRAALEALHATDIETWQLPGRWPREDPEMAAELLARIQVRRAQGEQLWVVVDGLIGSTMPELFGASAISHPGQPTRQPAQALRSPVQSPASDQHGAEALLIHLPLDAEPGADPKLSAAEAQAVAAAPVVIATSSWAGADVMARYQRQDVVVAPPGVQREVTPQRGATPQPDQEVSGESQKTLPHTLELGCVASLTPRKNHRLLLTALAELMDLPWQLHLVGPGAGSQYGRELLRDCDQQLPGRVLYHGALEAAQMQQFFPKLDLLLLPSSAETYGMVVTEAAVAGVPAFVSAGTGAEEALGKTPPLALQRSGSDDTPRRIRSIPAVSGLALPADQPAIWATELRRWLQDPDHRNQLRAQTAARAVTVPTWSQTAQILKTLSASPPSG